MTALEKENLKLRERLIALKDIQKSEKLCRFYTGFPNYGTFKAKFDYLNDAGATKRTDEEENCQQESFFLIDCKQNLHGPDSKLTLEEGFLIIMMRLKVGSFHKDLAHRLGMSEATISRVFTSWINLTVS